MTEQEKAVEAQRQLAKKLTLIVDKIREGIASLEAMPQTVTQLEYEARLLKGSSHLEQWAIHYHWVLYCVKDAVTPEVAASMLLSLLQKTKVEMQLGERHFSRTRGQPSVGSVARYFEPASTFLESKDKVIGLLFCIIEYGFPFAHSYRDFIEEAASSWG